MSVGQWIVVALTVYVCAGMLTAALVAPLFTKAFVGSHAFAGALWPLFLIVAYACRNHTDLRVNDPIEADYQEVLKLIEWQPKPRTAVDDVMDALETESE